MSASGRQVTVSLPLDGSALCAASVAGTNAPPARANATDATSAPPRPPLTASSSATAPSASGAPTSSFVTDGGAPAASDVSALPPSVEGGWPASDGGGMPASTGEGAALSLPASAPSSPLKLASIRGIGAPDPPPEHPAATKRKAIAATCPAHDHLRSHPPMPTN